MLFLEGLSFPSILLLDRVPVFLYIAPSFYFCMLWQYLLPLLISTFVTSALAVYAWRRRTLPGALALALTMLAVAYWTAGNIIELSSTSLPDKFFWLRMEYFGIVSVPVTWLAFTLANTGGTAWLTRRNWGLLYLIPGLTMLAIWTNGLHGWFWTEVALNSGIEVASLKTINGWYFWIHAAYSYLILMAGLARLIQVYLRGSGLYRWQSGLLIFGAIIPIGANLITVLGGNPILHLDITPFAMTITGITMAVAISRYGLLDIIPVARSALVESMTDAILVLNGQNRVVDLNPAMARVLGAERAALIGQQARDVLAAWPDLVAQFRDVRQTNTEFKTQAEPPRYFDLQITPLYDLQQRFQGRLFVLRDITALKQTEATLKRQTRLFENLVAVARASSQRLALDETLHNVISVSTELTGAEQGSVFLLDAQNQITHSILTQNDLSQRQRQTLLTEILQTGLAGWVVRTTDPALVGDVRTDPRWLDVEDLTDTIRSAMVVPIGYEGRVIGILTLQHSQVNYFTDDHLLLIRSACDQMALALRNASLYEEQRCLAERELTINRVLRAVSAHLDPDVAVRMAVESIAELTGWTTIAILMPDREHRNLIIKAASGMLSIASGWKTSIQNGISGRAFRTGQVQRVADVRQDPDYVPASSTVASELAVPLRRGDQVIAVLDIASNRVNAFSDEDLQLATLLADALVLALVNAGLYDEALRVRQAAEQANLAKSEFISVVAHELKIPMTSIKGYAGLMEDEVVGTVTPGQIDFLQIIRANVDRMATLVSDLADISRIESGRVRLDLQPVNLARAVGEVLQSTQAEIETKQHHLTLHIPESLPLARADKDRLAQVLTNLVSNAIKYTPPSGQLMIQIEPALEKSNPGQGERLLITIGDNGLGIKPQEQHKVFSKFFRSEDREVRAQPGTGLGLNITKLLVELQGGQIWFESQYGQGTRFFFTLPLIRD